MSLVRDLKRAVVLATIADSTARKLLASFGRSRDGMQESRSQRHYPLMNHTVLVDQGARF